MPRTEYCPKIDHRMDRRLSLLAVLALGIAPRAVVAQQPARLPVVGFLSPGFPDLVGSSIAITQLREGLRESGYIEGKSVLIESRWGLGKPETLDAFVDELVRLKVDVFVAVSPPVVMAAKKATGSLPIVAVDLETDPVASGLVSSLAKPRGNVTGLFLDLPELAGKWLQLIRELVPDAQRVAILWDGNTGPYQLDAIRSAAKILSVELDVVEFREASELENALAAGLKRRPQALVQLGSPLINGLAYRIADFSLKHRLPAVSPFRRFAESGGLLSYGPNLAITFRRTAVYVGRILKGAKPADLPIERPTHFEMVVNLKAAKALGIKLPQSVLVRADETIR